MIKCKKLTKKFGTKKVLDELDLTIPSRSVTALIGPSGAGKSVLSKAIAGLIDLDFGVVEIDEPELEDSRKGNGFERVSYVFQFGGLLDFMTLFENILFPMKRKEVMDKERAEFAFSLAEDLGIASFLDRQPKETPLAVRKLAALLRALMTESDWIFIDEPDSGLDPETISRLYSIISRFRTDRNLVIVSHDVPAVFEICDFYAMIYDGKIVSSGSLRKRENSYLEEKLESVLATHEKGSRSSLFWDQFSDDYIIQFIEGSSDGPIRLS